jgi:hypothetical protein
MTAPHIIDPAGLLGHALSDASPDLMRHLLSTVVNALLSADADAVCGAEYGTVSPERVTTRRCGSRRAGGRETTQTHRRFGWQVLSFQWDNQTGNRWSRGCRTYPQNGSPRQLPTLHGDR